VVSSWTSIFNEDSKAEVGADLVNAVNIAYSVWGSEPLKTHRSEFGKNQQCHHINQALPSRKPLLLICQSLPVELPGRNMKCQCLPVELPGRNIKCQCLPVELPGRNMKCQCLPVKLPGRNMNRGQQSTIPGNKALTKP
jgi:hypothetical protein